MEDEIEDYFNNHTLPMINEIGDVAKNVTQNWNMTFTMPEEAPAADPVPALALASTYVEPQPVAQESNGMVYAGVAFGVVAVLAAGALFKNCRSQKVNPNQEALL